MILHNSIVQATLSSRVSHSLIQLRSMFPGANFQSFGPGVGPSATRCPHDVVTVDLRSGLQCGKIMNTPFGIQTWIYYGKSLEFTMVTIHGSFTRWYTRIYKIHLLSSLVTRLPLGPLSCDNPRLVLRAPLGPQRPQGLRSHPLDPARLRQIAAAVGH